MQLSAAEQANQQLVDALIVEGSLWSPALIAAFRATPRHRFIDRVFQYQPREEHWREVLTREPGPEEVRLLYSDRALITHLSPATPERAPVPISSSSQPSLMAQMLEDLRLAPGQRVLEIGAGTGYNAALMAHVAGPGRVVSIDVDRSVLSEAWDHLRAFPERQVQIQHADGREGYAEAAPFDRLMVTAATPDLEPAWLEQLAPEGLLVAPLVLAPGLAFVVRGTVAAGIFHGRLMRAAYFMPLRAEGEPGETDVQESQPMGESRTVPAPWSGWFDRKRNRVSWLRFSQSLAFYGLLHGLGVHYRGQPSGPPCFGVSRAKASDWCWFGPQEWQVSGPEGRALGNGLWHEFLAAGAPWPTEFRLRAAFGTPVPPSGGSEEYVQSGPRCQHIWELIEPRDRPIWA